MDAICGGCFARQFYLLGHFPRLQYFVSTSVLSHWDFFHGISGCFPQGKPAATESRYPTYNACMVFECFHNPPDSDTDYRIFNVRTDVTLNACDRTREYSDRVCTGSWLKEKSLAAPMNRTCVSGVPVRRSTNWATFPTPVLVTYPHESLKTDDKFGLLSATNMFVPFLFRYGVNTAVNKWTLTLTSNNVTC